MVKKRRSLGEFIINGGFKLLGNDDEDTSSGRNFLKSLSKIPSKLLQQIKENRLAVNLSKRHGNELTHGQRLDKSGPKFMPPRPSPGGGYGGAPSHDHDDDNG